MVQPLKMVHSWALPVAMIAAMLTAAVVPLRTVHAQGAACGTSIAPSAQDGNQAVATAYQAWKKAYVTSNGAGTNLRVQRSTNDNYDTVSEGIAYGMLFAAYNNDKTTFDSLYAYEQAHLDSNGLMNWRIDGGGGTNGYNSATDADEDMAIALIAADKQWSGYTVKATKQIQLVRNTEVESGSYVLKPGDMWGGSDVSNPSYIAPAYYDVFQTYTGDTSWATVKTTGYKTLANLQANTAGKTTGLLPDWSNASGGPANGMGFSYGYDAVRSPLRLATASAWSCDTTAAASLAPFTSTFQKIGLANIVDGYGLDATPYGSKLNTGIFIAPVAAAATTSSDNTYRTAAWNKLVATTNTGYYGDSLQMFSLLLGSGSFVSPLTLTATTPITPAPAPAPTPTPTPPATPPSSGANIDIWWPSNGSTVTGTQPFKALVSGSDTSNYAMYWQVDGGVLNLMANNSQDYPHKQADVDVTNWSWRGTGPYTITFVAKDSAGTVIATKSSTITVK